MGFLCLSGDFLKPWALLKYFLGNFFKMFSRVLKQILGRVAHWNCCSWALALDVLVHHKHIASFFHKLGSKTKTVVLCCLGFSISSSHSFLFYRLKVNIFRAKHSWKIDVVDTILPLHVVCTKLGTIGELYQSLPHR